MSARPLSSIGDEIKASWAKPYFGAVPYIDAMRGLGSIEDDYFMEPGHMIVRYFLSNANTWRGEDARRIKAELKGMLK